MKITLTILGLLFLFLLSGCATQSQHYMTFAEYHAQQGAMRSTDLPQMQKAFAVVGQPGSKKYKKIMAQPNEDLYSIHVIVDEINH